jgi:hypothetical protein
VPNGGTIRGHDPFEITDLLQQASDTMTLINQTVESLSGDAETAMQDVTGTARYARNSRRLRPDLEAMANNGRTISNDTADLIAKINGGHGTLGELANDDELYDNLQKASTQAQEAMTNLRQVSDEARRARWRSSQPSCCAASSTGAVTKS